MIARTEIKWDNASAPFPIRSTMSVLTLVNKTHNALEEIKKIIGNSVIEDWLKQNRKVNQKNTRVDVNKNKLLPNTAAFSLPQLSNNVVHFNFAQTQTAILTKFRSGI